MGDDAFDTFDELPSLYVDDSTDRQQLLQLTPVAATHIGAPGDLSAPPIEPLSTEEVAELLRSIDGDDAEVCENDESAGLQQQQRLLEQSPGASKLTPTLITGKKAGKRKKTPGKNPNKARDGRKEELVYLRKTVLELETRLSVLQKRNGDSELPITAPATGCYPDEPSTTQQLSTYYSSRTQPPTTSFPSLLMQNGAQDNAELPDVWREIARRQCEERDKSERENIRLRLMLESQLKVARSLEKFMLLKAASTMEISKTVDIRHHHHSSHSNLSEDPSDAEIYHDLLVGVEQSITEVDAVYEANGLTNMETNQMSAQMRFNPENGMFVEVCAAKVLPFGIHETGEAVWNHYLFAKQRMPSRYYSYHSHKSIDATDNTIVEDFLLELHAKNTRASFRVRQITRRVVEEERIVIVWRTFFDPIEFSEQQLSSVRFFQKGYIVIRKSSPSVSKPSVTLLQPCYIIYPHSTTLGGGVAGENESVVGAITDFMLSSTVANVAATHQMIENVLLEQTLTSRGLESEGRS